MGNIGGLRRRWLRNTASVVVALGLVCVMAITAAFAAYYYSNMESDLKHRAKSTTDFFAASFARLAALCVAAAVSFAVFPAWRTCLT